MAETAEQTPTQQVAVMAPSGQQGQPGVAGCEVCVIVRQSPPPTAAAAAKKGA